MSHAKLGRMLILAGLGAVATTLGDLNHVHTQTLAYQQPFLLGQAWWVFPVFFLAFAAMCVSYRILARKLPLLGLVTTQSQSEGSASAFVEALLAFMSIYLVSGFGNQDPELLSWVFYGTFALRWSFSYERAWLLLLALLMGAGGMFAEGLMGASGIVAYRHMDVFHVPLWLGGLYLHGAFALREGMRLFAPAPD